MKAKIEQNNTEDHVFLLKCMLALATAGVIAMGIMAALAIKASAATASATFALATVGAGFFPILPVIIGLAVLSLFVSPLFLMGGGFNTMFVTNPNLGFGGYNSYNNTPYNNGYYSQRFYPPPSQSRVVLEQHGSSGPNGGSYPSGPNGGSFPGGPGGGHPGVHGHG